MFRSLRRRALVAIIAALGLVVGAAAPAHAAYSLLYSNSAGQGGVAWGYGYVYNDGLYIGIQGHPYKYYTGGPVDEYT